MFQDRIDTTLTAEQVTAITTALTSLEDALPFTTSLTGPQRRELVKLGARSESFATKALEAGQQYSQLLPSTVSLTKLQRDATLRLALHPIRSRVLRLGELVNDTYALAGSDLMSGCLVIYRTLQIHRYGVGLEGLLTEMGQRFARGARTPVDPAPAPTEGGTTAP